MNVQVMAVDDYTIVNIEGRIDTTNANEFEKSVMDVIDSGAIKIILNCVGLNYISSSGLRVFLIALKKMKACNGQLRLCNLQPVIKDIFDVAGFTSIFSVYDDQEIALKE